MLHLPASENHGELDLVLLFEKFLRVLHLELEIVLFDLRPELDLLQMRYMLFLLGITGLLALLVLVLPKIHDLADRRPHVGAISTRSSPFPLLWPSGLVGGHDAELLAVLIDHPDLGDSDHMIDPGPRLSSVVSPEMPLIRSPPVLGIQKGRVVVPPARSLSASDETLPGTLSRP